MASEDRFAAFRHPGVLRFALGRFGSALAVSIATTAIGWQLYERTNSRFALGLTGLVELIPVVLLAIPAGLVSDRYPRPRIAAAAHVLLGLCTASMAALTFTSGPVWLYYVLLLLTGVGTAFRASAVSTMVPLLVPQRDFVNTNAWMSSSFQLASMAGPALAGFLIDWHGDATAAFVGATLAHIAFVAVLLTMPPLRAQERAARARGLGDLFAGLSFIFRARPFLAAITLDLFAVLLAGAEALLPVFAKDVLHVGPAGLGWLRAAPAMGAFSMAVLQTRLPPWKRPGIAMLWTVVGFGLATIVFGASTSFWLSMVALYFAGVFDNVSVVIRSTLEQSLTPDSMRGRVSAMHYVFVGISNELGTFESGTAAALLGAVPAVVFGGLGCLAVVAVMAWRFPELRHLGPLHTLKPLDAPDAAA